MFHLSRVNGFKVKSIHTASNIFFIDIFDQPLEMESGIIPDSEVEVIPSGNAASVRLDNEILCSSNSVIWLELDFGDNHYWICFHKWL